MRLCRYYLGKCCREHRGDGICFIGLGFTGVYDELYSPVSYQSNNYSLGPDLYILITLYFTYDTHHADIMSIVTWLAYDTTNRARSGD